MLRDKHLVTFSHQHQHALALCVRIERALPDPQLNIEQWEGEIVQMFDSELETHFESEERIIFPAAAQIESLRDVLAGLNADHTRLRVQAMEARQHQLDVASLARFAKLLAEHVRTEERVLFEQMQVHLGAQDLERIGAAATQFMAQRELRR